VSPSDNIVEELLQLQDDNLAMEEDHDGVLVMALHMMMVVVEFQDK